MKEAALKSVIAIACGYEVMAITTRKVPTISKLNAKYRWLGPLIVGYLASHFAYIQREQMEREQAENGA